MIHGIYVGRYMISGAITMTVFVARAISKFFEHEFLDMLTNPFFVFVAFIIAGIVVLYPWLTGVKAVILMPLLVLFVAFFVYAYYVVP